jgi:folate-binding protein YgfZ
MEPPRDVEQVLGRRDVVVVEGADAQSYLHSQVSQDVNGMAVGDQRWTFVLEPNGKIAGFARVTRVDEERFDLDTDEGFGEGLLARIDRFKIRVAAETALGEPYGESRDEAARVAMGWPGLGSEIVPGESIPGGTGVVGVAVNFTKGCYPGQELVERMDSRSAEAPRSLRRLTVAEGATPGDSITDEDGAEVGVLTSVAGTAALGWVKRASHVGDLVEF